MQSSKSATLGYVALVFCCLVSLTSSAAVAPPPRPVRWLRHENATFANTSSSDATGQTNTTAPSNASTSIDSGSFRATSNQLSPMPFVKAQLQGRSDSDANSTDASDYALRMNETWYWNMNGKLKRRKRQTVAYLNMSIN